MASAAESNRTRIEKTLADLPLKAALERVARPDVTFGLALANAGIDRAWMVIDLYEARGVVGGNRKSAGVYYTPQSIVAAMLDRLPDEGEWLDPAAGAGAFLVSLARRFGPSILSRLSACDVDGGALDAAALALEAALGADARNSVAKWRKSRAHEIDFLRDAYPGPSPRTIVGNPPYKIDGGGALAKLFPILGGEVDLYACFLARALQLLGWHGNAKKDATVALLVPDTWLTNSNAQSLRRALADFGVARVVDFGKPFREAKDTRVHAVIATAGATTCRVEATRNGQLVPMANAARQELQVRAPRGWLLYRTDAEMDACAAMGRSPRLETMLDVVYGLRTGDNKRHIVEGDGGVPLVAGRDLEAYDRRVVPRHLRDPREFQKAASRQTGRWKIGIQRIRTNSTQPWRKWIEAAPLSPSEVGLDSLTLVADREPAKEPSETLLHALGVLNSSILNRLYRLSFTDVNVKPVYIRTLPMPLVDRHIAALVRKRLKSAHDSTGLERAIDRLVADAYELSAAQVECLEAGFWEGQGAALPSRKEALAA